MTVASTHKEPYARKCREGVLIIAEEQEIMLNSNRNFYKERCPVPGAREDLDR